jgi:hypothetical protein
MGAEMSSKAFRKIRRECYEAMSSSYVETLDTGSLVDDIFDIVTKTIREHFGIRFQTVDLILRDARIEADNLFDEKNLDDFVNIDETIETIAKYLAEEDEVPG